MNASLVSRVNLLSGVQLMVDLARDLSSPVTKVSRSPKARFDREHVETFLDSHSREKNVYKSEMELLLKVK